MGRMAVLALRVVIVLMFAAMLALQAAMLPLLAVDPDGEVGELTHLRWPIVVICFLAVAAVEVALVCLWRLLTMVRRDTVFSPAAFRYVDVVIGAAVAGSVLALALGTVLAPGEAVAPGIVLIIGVGAIGGIGIALLVLVMRALLAKAVALDSTATTLRAELDEVI
ncbi:DUF2975 domain-containing protein [Cellulomonas sp. NS3]|uniref:DUF2975 domain-containing protein n=1 Tax=Cellulomonas sp. NS3 TaxID=2973977 RepID=UPI002162A60D|nr:DUF2975 domain-containing protein [Cellulomonas sp. NS3]